MAETDAESAYNKAIHEMHEQMQRPLPSPPSISATEQQSGPGLVMGIGLAVMFVLVMGWATLISLGNMQQTDQLQARGCERVYDVQDARLVGKIVDMSKEVWACKDGGIVSR